MNIQITFLHENYGSCFTQFNQHSMTSEHYPSDILQIMFHKLPTIECTNSGRGAIVQKEVHKYIVIKLLYPF